MILLYIGYHSIPQIKYYSPETKGSALGTVDLPAFIECASLRLGPAFYRPFGLGVMVSRFWG